MPTFTRQLFGLTLGLFASLCIALACQYLPSAETVEAKREQVCEMVALLPESREKDRAQELCDAGADLPVCQAALVKALKAVD